MKLTKNIWLEELVPEPEFLALDGINLRTASRMVDMRVPRALQAIRDRFGKPVRLNNWKWKQNGQLNLRGWRPFVSGIYPYLKTKDEQRAETILRELLEIGWSREILTTGSWLSDHKSFRAADYEVDGHTADELREDILNNQEFYMKLGITNIESGEYAPTWCHISFRYMELDYIYIVKP